MPVLKSHARAGSPPFRGCQHIDWDSPFGAGKLVAAGRTSLGKLVPVGHTSLVAEGRKHLLDTQQLLQDFVADKSAKLDVMLGDFESECYRQDWDTYFPQTS